MKGLISFSFGIIFLIAAIFIILNSFLIGLFFIIISGSFFIIGLIRRSSELELKKLKESVRVKVKESK